MADDSIRTYRILAVDDEEGMLTLYRDVLCVEGGGPNALESVFSKVPPEPEPEEECPGGPLFDVTLCVSGEQALEAVVESISEGRPYAVLLMDIRLGEGMDGVAAAERIRDLDPGLEIVMVTGHSDVTLRELNRRIAPPEKLLFLQKPFRPRELRQLASALCGKWITELQLKELNATLAQKVDSRTRALKEANAQLMTDILEQMELEEKLRQSQKMEALGTLAGGIAHDFNNILGVIMGYGEIILESAERESGLERRAREIVKAGHRARDLINQILNFSRQVPQEKKPLDPVPLIKEAMKLLRSSIPSAIDIRTSFETSERIMGDPTQLHQILLNLCTNASHAMGGRDGVLTVSLCDADDGFHLVPPEELGKPRWFVRLSVRDTGQGIDPEIIGRIFDPFFTTKRPGEGTGMGLAVVHGIVKGHEGSVQVESEPGRGTVFHVFLPRATDMDAEKDAPAPVRLPEHLHVLFVDDEKTLVDIGREMLEGLGFTVTGRTSSVEALEAFRYRPEDFDLVITDQTMPNMSGVEMAVEILSIRSDIPVILCTGFAEALTCDRVRSLGIRDFVMKPVVREQLVQSIGRVMEAVEREASPDQTASGST